MKRHVGSLQLVMMDIRKRKSVKRRNSRDGFQNFPVREHFVSMKPLDCLWTSSKTPAAMLNSDSIQTDLKRLAPKNKPARAHLGRVEARNQLAPLTANSLKRYFGATGS